MQYFKPAVLRGKAERKRSCCVCQRSYYHKKRADNPLSTGTRFIGFFLLIALCAGIHNKTVLFGLGAQNGGFEILHFKPPFSF